MKQMNDEQHWATEQGSFPEFLQSGGSKWKKDRMIVTCTIVQVL